MSVCWFYIQGRCRFGDRCRNLHPNEGYSQSQKQNGSYDKGRSSNSPLARASSFDFNATLEQARNQDERNRQRSYNEREWAHDGSYTDFANSYKGHGHARPVQRQEWNRESHDRYRWSRDDKSRQNRGSEDRTKEQSPITFDFNKALEEVAALDEDLSESTSDQALGVIFDMKVWEASGQWPFSSYGPFGNALSYPAFSDISMEELRWECYQSVQTGTLDAYVQHVSQAAQDVQRNRQLLVTMAPPTKEILSNLSLGKTSAAPSAPANSGIGVARAVPSLLNSGSSTVVPQTQVQWGHSVTSERSSVVEDTGSLYTPIKELTQGEREQFLAEYFTPGKMPLRPDRKSVV